MRDRLRSKLNESAEKNETIEENNEDSPTRSINKENSTSEDDDQQYIDAQDIETPEINAPNVQEKVSENYNQEENFDEGNLEKSVTVSENSTLAQSDPQESQNSANKTVLSQDVSEETTTVEKDRTNSLVKEPVMCNDEILPNEESDVDIFSKKGQEGINLSLNIAVDVSTGLQDITSPVTESAEDALNYISSSTEGASTELEDDFVSTFII